jgi:hypothetical protein
MSPYYGKVGVVRLPSPIYALMKMSENAGYVVSVGMKSEWLGC